MKTKYSSIIKVKKQALERAENNLNKAKARQLENQKKLEQAIKECDSLSIPQKGDANELRQSMQMLQIARDSKERAAQKVLLSDKEIVHYQHLYKKANFDYEKIKYLEAEEIKKIKKELEKIEAKNLDEIAISRFFRSKNEDEI